MGLRKYTADNLELLTALAEDYKEKATQILAINALVELEAKAELLYLVDENIVIPPSTDVKVIGRILLGEEFKPSELGEEKELIINHTTHNNDNVKDVTDHTAIAKEEAKELEFKTPKDNVISIDTNIPLEPKLGVKQGDEISEITEKTIVRDYPTNKEIRAYAKTLGYTKFKARKVETMAEELIRYLRAI